MKKLLFCIVLITHIVFMLSAQNTNFPVGAIPGEIDVSPMGVATYTIPIEVVPGTQGMQPNLSIVYNSFGGMGLLGMKWNLSGLSAITRCGQNSYYEVTPSSIQFNENDRFTIDDNRLMRLNSGSYGTIGGEYATEVEDFTRIISYDGTIGHPEYFKAYTDDGSIIEYGNTNDSKQKLGTGSNSVILSWFVNKITDFNGNYMTFDYVQVNNNEILINTIEYTGNSGLQPYAKVQFNYIDLPNLLGNNTYFVSGYGITQTRLLETILVSNNNATVRKYKFCYNLDSEERTAHLKKIIQYAYGENGTAEQLNETSISWGKQNTTIEQKQIKLYVSPNEKILTGDFYGNGYDDLLVYNIASNGLGKGWRVYKYDSLYGEHYEDESARDTGTIYDALYAHDVNGDGRDELIIHTRSALYRFLEIPSKTLLDSVFAYENVCFGDFDGNGSIDIVFYSTYVLSIKSVVNNKIRDMCLSISMGTRIQDVRVLDATGDGKKNILVLTNGATLIYQFNGYEFQTIFQGTLPFPMYGGEVDYTYYFGDLNGDGITDVVVYCFDQGSPRSWKIYMSKGVGSYDVCVLNNEALYTASLYPIIVTDLNDDGKDDIVQILDDGVLNILFSNGWINGDYKYTKKEIVIPNENYWKFFKNVSVGKLEGNGKIIIIKPTIGYPWAFFFNKDNDFEFVQTITDGMGRNIKLNYKHKYYLAKEACFNEDCIDLKKGYFLSLVNLLSISNGIGNSLISWQYQYEKALFSSTRKTLLGFKEFFCINNQNNKKDEFLFDYDRDDVSRQILLLVKQLSFFDNIKIKERYYYVDCFDIYNENSDSHDRYLLNYSIIEDYDSLLNTTNVTKKFLNEYGRLIESVTKTYDGLDTTLNDWMKRVTNTYSYQTITLNGNQKKNVPTQILTTQQYGSSGTVITDTLTYGFYLTDSNKGRLQWVRKGNSDGSITFTYENYTTAGLVGKKTVSAQGCTARIETFQYDATQRFISKIINSMNHVAEFSYDPKKGNRISEKDPNGLITNYTYDSFGNLTKIAYPDNTQTINSVQWYSGSIPNAKYKITTNSSGKPTITVYYDLLGREVCRYDDGYFYDTRYNAKGQIDSISYPYDNISEPDTIWCTYTYDYYGRKLTEKAPYTNFSYSYNNRNVTVTNNGVSSSKNYDALGRITQAVDEGGTIDYSYTVTNDKRHQTTITTNNTDTFIECDLWGNRLSITDPNAGEITATYNGFNELLTQTDANGNKTAYQYDTLGRISKKIFTASDNSSQSITYVYWTTGKGSIGKLRAQVMSGAGATDSFDYDTLGRLKQCQTLFGNGGERASLNYTYNSNGQLQTLKYPDNFKVNYSYTTTGKLNEIRDGNDNSLIYKVISRNKYNQPTGCEYGNGVITEYEYDLYGLLTRIKTGKKNYDFTDPPPNDKGVGVGTGLSYWVDSTILNYRYAYNDKGLMSSRSESTINQIETYTYDDLDRLLTVTAGKIGQTGTTQSLIYHNNGNILNNSAVGTYSYKTNGSNKPHAVTEVEPVSHSIISANQCDVTYNFFNQPTQIEEGDASATLSSRIELFYGVNQQRNKSMMYKDSILASMRYYFGKYFEKEIAGTTDTACRYDYIYGDNGVVALHTTTILPSTDTTGGGGDPRVVADGTYYIHTDHLGSYCALTDLNKKVVQRNYFDPWGNFKWVYKGRGDEFEMTDSLQRDTISMQPIATANFTVSSRGFTGHEHYPQFKIINMNGRLYDPVICRFFSPDNYVQSPGFTQSFNRYSYALNNPLKFIDPTGQWYEDSYWDDDRDYYDDDWNPRDPWKKLGYKSGIGRVDLGESNRSSLPDGRDGRDYLNEERDRDSNPNSWLDHFDSDGMVVPGDDPANPTLRRGGVGINNQGIQMMANLYWHYQFGGGKAYFIDASKFNFSHTSRQQLGIPTDLKIGDKLSVNLFNQGINALSLSFGNVRMVYHGNDQFSIMRDRFDFDHQKGASFSRNAATLVGSLFFGNIYESAPASPFIQPNVFFGGPYWIYFWGLITIR